jgi:sensor c-di-GMP phosphodiesterase-like protein
LQKLGKERDRVSLLANDVLRRADTSFNQMDDAFSALNAAVSKTPCSDEGISLMARIAVASEEVQGLGYVSDNRLLCSSLGRYPEGIPIGTPDYRSAKGVDVRTGVELPTVSGIKFIMFTNATTGFSSIVHPKLPLDVFTTDPDLTVGIVGYSQKKLIDLRGQ